MRRTTTALVTGASAVALALALPVSANSAVTSGQQFAVSGFGAASMPGASVHEELLNQWRGYALSGITPQFRWSEVRVDSAPPSLAAHYSRIMVPMFARADDAAGGRRNALSVAIHSAMVGESPAVAAGNLATGAISSGSPGLQRIFVTPSFTQTWGDSGTWTLSAILAHQRFASMGMGSVAWSPAFHGMVGTHLGETSVGAGGRLELTDRLSDRVSWALAWQSKLDMDAFKFYRGVFSDAGDFDVPGHAAAGLNVQLMDRWQLGLGVQQVFYSDVSAFTSAALPVRFLALLGDASSPEFAWRDLTVYSAALSWSRAPGESWTFRYTSRQQPAPTSALLRQALEPEFTNTNLALAFNKDLGRFGQFVMAASYAPKQYFLATGPFTNRSNPGRQQREFEAHWGFQF
jgi:hypothetical protein